MSEPVLSDSDLAAALSGPDAPEWELVGGRLLKTVSCAGFVGSVAYVNEVGVLAEAANHHPDIDIRYNRVTLSLMTHDSGGITQKDIDLAKRIDQVTAGLK
jgi:4a-hydroxytetrahydrobiopterin dehydratase